MHVYITCLPPFSLSLAIFKCHKNMDRKNNFRRKKIIILIYHIIHCVITLANH